MTAPRRFPSFRWTAVAIGAAVIVLAVGALAARQATKSPAAAGSAMVAAGSIDDLLMDLQLVPLDGQAPKPFALPSLDGRKVALADLAGRPALLYFWATW